MREKDRNEKSNAGELVEDTKWGFLGKVNKI